MTIKQLYFCGKLDSILYKEEWYADGIPQTIYNFRLKNCVLSQKAGYTQETFAEKVGKSVNFIAQVEGTGTIRGISLETLFKIADVLNIEPAKLLEND